MRGAPDAGELEDQLSDAEKRIEQLEAALMPFAQYYDKMIDDEAEVATLTKADFVRAFNAMSN
jgi:hypothetical protein